MSSAESARAAAESVAAAPAPFASAAEAAAWVQAEADRLEAQSPYRIVEAAFAAFGTEVALSFSGAEDVLVVDLAVQVAGRDVSVFCLDTGRLHPETYRFLEQVREHYGIAMSILSPDSAALERLVAAKGLFSFLRDGHGECCGIRKVEPLRRHLRDRRAWMTGQRRDQSPGTRGGVAVVELDRSFGRDDAPLVKFNPLAAWSSAQVWQYLRGAGIPTNPLHGRGFVSIGCEPCTRAVLPGEHERAGRWWWEEATQKECGLHAGNLVEPGGG